MYHPAAALHQGSLRKTIEDDFKKIPAYLEQARGDRGCEPAAATELRSRSAAARRPQIELR